MARLLQCSPYADVAQLVEHNLAKVGVAGSNPVVRSKRMTRSGHCEGSKSAPRGASRRADSPQLHLKGVIR
jgi:hypothetical protein